MGTPAVSGNSESCMCVASLLVVVWEDNISRMFFWEELGGERMVQGQ